MGAMRVAQLLGVGCAMGGRGVAAEMCEGAALAEFERCANTHTRANTQSEAAGRQTDSQRHRVPCSASSVSCKARRPGAGQRVRQRSRTRGKAMPLTASGHGSDGSAVVLHHV
jgi:hypothetical protein